MSTRLRELWKAELRRRAEAALLPGESLDVAARAVALALSETPDPPADQVRPLLYPLGEMGAMLKQLDEVLTALPSNDEVALSLEQGRFPDYARQQQRPAVGRDRQSNLGQLR
jgi:hypothetical protein